MLAISAALGAALAWGVSAAGDNRSTRLFGSLQALACQPAGISALVAGVALVAATR